MSGEGAPPNKSKERANRLLAFAISPVGVLKFFEVALLVASLTLFLGGKRCMEWPVHEVLYGLPLGLCSTATFITLVVAARVAYNGRIPVTVPTWAKGEVLFNVAAVVLLVFTEAVAVSDFKCINHVETIIALSLSLIAILLYVGSGALVWLLYIHHQEQLRAAEQRRRASRAVVAVANAQLRTASVIEVQSSN